METAVHCLRRNPALQFIIPAANADRYRQLHLQLSSYIDYPIHLVNGQSQTVMAAADVVLMASGTTALEAMLLKRPMVIAYKLSWLSWAILSRMVKTPYVGLPNLLAGKKLIPELLQDDATPENMSAAVMHYFEHPQETQALRDTFYDMHQSIKRNASDRAADAIAQLIQTKELQHDAT